MNDGMETYELKIEDIQNICRICLSENVTMNNIYKNRHPQQISVIQILENCMSIKVDENENLPSLICQQCECTVFEIHKFKMKFDRSYNILCAHLDALTLNTITNVKEDLKAEPDIEKDNFNDSKYSYPVIDALPDSDSLEVIQKCIKDETEVAKPEQLYTCNQCNQSFNTKIKLMDHRRKLLHYNKKPATCPKFKVTVPVQTYKSGFLKHSSHFCCEYCGKKFSTHFNLNRHMCIHTNVKPYVCDLCGAKFARQDNLKGHVVIHTREKPFVCKTCGKQFEFREELKRHQENLVCHDGKPNDCFEKYKRTLTCDVCSKSFTLQSSLNIHKLLHTDERVICSACGKPYPNEKKLKEHKLLVHNRKMTEEKDFLCNICAKQYSSSPVLKRHMLTHLGLSKTYSCKVCSKSFTQSGSLALHLNIHTGEKPFVCHICPRAFNKPSNLQRHLRNHDRVRPHVCPFCEKCFSEKYSLTIHTRIHTGEKPYACPSCGKKFVDRGSLCKHSKIHNE